MDEECKTMNTQRRDDYTNLSIIYWLKIVALIIVVLAGIIVTFDDFKSLLITAFTFFIGVIFDFIVILMKNKGPKIKLRIVVTKGAIFIVTVGIIVSILCIIYLLNHETIDQFILLSIKFYIYAAMLCGIISPVLELIINKPNDD